MDVVGCELPAGVGDAAVVAAGGDGVGDGCLGGEEAVEGVGLGEQGGAVGEKEVDGCVRWGGLESAMRDFFFFFFPGWGLEVGYYVGRG